MPHESGILAAREFIPCKGLVFDKDGTLIDIWPMLNALGRERMRHLSHRVRGEALESVAKCTGYDWHTGRAAPFGPLASATRRDEIAVAACGLYLAGIPWHQAYTMCREACDEADRTLDVTKDTLEIDGAARTLASLHESGLALYVATSDSHGRSEKMLEHAGLARFFRRIVGSDDVSSCKPDPEAVLICAADLGVSPSELVVVGDGPQDSLMARKAGARPVGVLTGVGTYQDLHGLSEVVLPSVADIRPAQPPNS